MSIVDIPFTSFTPDLPALNNPGLVRAHNCTAGLGSTQGGVTLFPLKSASLFANTTMESAPLGTAIGADSSSNAKVYGGSAAKLYRLAPTSRAWTDISRPGGYATTEGEHWKFVEFGSLQIGTNMTNEPQFIDMNADVQFADLTTLVKGRHIATNTGFVILGNTFDSFDGAVPYRVRWSGIEAPSDFNFSPATGADFQDIQGFGSITGIVTDDSVWVLLQRGIVQMQFAGAPYWWQFNDRVTGKGCTVAESVITVEGAHYFLSDDGFYRLQGGQLTPISQGKVAKFFLDNFDSSQAKLMTVAADPRETLIYWQYASVNAVNGKPDMQLIYNYHTGEWTTADATTHFVFNAVSLSWSIDELDTFGTLDDVPSSWDSPVWSGGKAQLWGMNQAGQVYSFGGPTLEALIETPEYQLSRMVPNQSQADVAIIDAARPLFEGDATARVQVGTRALPNADLKWSPMKETNGETGFAYFREMSRYQRFLVRLSGDWSRSFGVQIDAKSAGQR